MSRKRGFTLIELLVVMVIIGILAAVAAPMMANLKKRAIVTEAVMGLGTIRTAMRMYYIEHNNSYSGCVPDMGFFGTGENDTIPGITNRTGASYADGLGDLDGTYFSQECYYIILIGESYVIVCYVQPDEHNGKANEATKATETLAMFPHDNARIQMNTSGNIASSYMPGSGYQ